MGKVVDKLFSARFIMSTFTTLAACFIIFTVFKVCASKDKLDVGVAVVMGFMAIWKEIVMAYFDRQDRGSDTTTTATQTVTTPPVVNP